MANYLAVMAKSRNITPALQSFEQLDAGEHTLTRIIQDGGDDPAAKRWENLLVKNKAARLLCLEGHYDGLLLVEDDQIVPSDGLLRLIAMNTDIAYGLVTSRHYPHLWSAGLVTGPTDQIHRTLDSEPDAMRGTWGRVIDCEGCGLFFTLIRRHVLEAIEFRLDGWRAADFYFAIDAQAQRFSQQVDTRILCGHVMNEDGPPWHVVWPDVASRYRYEERVA